MLRVNPYKIRISQYTPDYWVFEGDYLQDKTVRKFDDEVRPYRILIKENLNSSKTNNKNINKKKHIKEDSEYSSDDNENYEKNNYEEESSNL